jgi:hypothetical protein
VLGGCAGNSGTRHQAKPDVGAAPAYAGPVQVPAPREGESPVVAGDRYRRGLDRANTIIRCLVADQARTRATFLGQAAEPSNCATPADAAKGRRKARRTR